MAHHDFDSLSTDELTRTTGGRTIAPSTGINAGVNLMSLLDKPQKTLDTAKGFLGIQDSGAPGSIYTPAQMNSDGGITPGRFDMPRDPGLPQVPMSQ